MHVSVTRQIRETETNERSRSGQLALNIWQTYRLINTASTSLGSILQADIFANMVVILLVGISNFAAAVFYSRRAWKVRGPLRVLEDLTDSVASLVGWRKVVDHWSFVSWHYHESLHEHRVSCSQDGKNLCRQHAHPTV